VASMYGAHNTYDIFDKLAEKEPRFSHTVLSPGDEKRFQKEFTGSPWYKDFVMRNKEDPLKNPDYDYRGAWLGGKDVLDLNKPEAHGLSRDPKTKKWLKDPRAHGTSWKEFLLDKSLGTINPDAGDGKMTREEGAILLESFLKQMRRSQQYTF